ncbi:MAG: N-acetyl-gamma-glutamyl-phosphate reductase [Bacteroidetes bacterium ADurb.Bin416]|jgi:N-acetyl-gamma-glutamyl-phosphate reductase|nr:MAG: N-acetyl-gamma-glutamyl-phosphate reductase [Bacteroidetes bacterium ADurb.Bin416]
MIKTGIIGGAGYTAGELLRILINHPAVEIVFVHSSSQAGSAVCDLHSGLVGECNLVFTDQLPLDRIDLLYLCSAHGDSKRFLDEHPVPATVKIIDLSTDFRHQRPDHDFVYGLPELNRDAIKTAMHVANPGCFATGIQLALLPLASAGVLKGDVHINAITGSTGAGVKPSPTTHFSWRNDNISVYKPFTHQHLQEIEQSVRQLSPTFDKELLFIPVRGDFARGIFTMVYTDFEGSLEQAHLLYACYYQQAAFTHLTDKELDMKQVVNTNKGLIQLKKHGNKLLILTAIDNLLKGASGQAVQNMNLMFGLDETTGLALKSIGF